MFGLTRRFKLRPAPDRIGGAKVLWFSPIDHRHRPTGCRHLVGEDLQGAAAGLAICEYENEDAFYLFGCDAEWKSVTDSWHPTVEEARRQAEFEYEGVSATWQEPQDGPA
jgi:hypothetical protein